MDAKQLKEIVSIVKADPRFAEALESLRKTVQEELGPGASFGEFEVAMQSRWNAVVRGALEAIRAERSGGTATKAGGGPTRRKRRKSERG